MMWMWLKKKKDSKGKKWGCWQQIQKFKEKG